MLALFLLGWAFLLAAFVAAALETMAHVVTGTGGLVVSAHDVWYAHWPGSLIITQILVERHLHPLLWDPIMTTLLGLPGWLLFGGPGFVLVWFFRPNRGHGEEIDEQSIFLYDALAEAALEEEENPGEDDRLPDHGPDGEYDPAGTSTRHSPEEYLAELDWPPDADGEAEDSR